MTETESTTPVPLNDLGSPALSQLEEKLRVAGQGFPGLVAPEVEATTFFRHCLGLLGVPNGSTASVELDGRAPVTSLSWIGAEPGLRAPTPILTISPGMNHPVTVMHAAALASVTGGAEGGRAPRAEDGPTLITAFAFLVETEHTWLAADVRHVQAGLTLTPVAGQRPVPSAVLKR